MTNAGTIFLGRKLRRREVLKSAMSGAGLVGLPFGPWMNALSAATSGQKQRSLILLWQDGGPSHFETFDPKPYAPSEYRGELGAIQTSLSGVEFCEVLPRLAQLAHRFSVIRSLHQPSSGHVDGSHNVLTGWYGQTEGAKSRYPDLAAVISHMRTIADGAEISLGESTDPRLAQGMRGNRNRSSADGSALPAYVDISKGIHRGGPAFLGPLHGPFQIAGDPSKPGFTVQNLLSVGSASRFLEREQVRARLDRLVGASDHATAGFEQLRAVDGFRQQAVELVMGGKAARAFDLSREAPEVRDRYGRHLGGQQCLLARRLVEAGVGVVAVRFAPDGRGDYERTMIGWDDHAVHGNIFSIMRKRGPQFDQSVSALIEDLETRGMQDDVLVVVVGEFGRTPRIHVHKGCPGREHWGPAGCALVYGGGLNMGQIIGSTNDKGERPLERPLSYQDLLATLYRAVGINPQHTFVDPTDRPVPILPSGQPITELTGSSAAGTDSSPTIRKPAVSMTRLVPAAPQNATSVLPAGATNADLAAASALRDSEVLVARDSTIDDEGLVHLTKCRRLKRLQLNEARITDSGLIHLANLTSVEELNLTGTHVSDRGLQYLKSLTRLKRIDFNGTGITLSGVVRLFVQQQRTLGDALTAMGLAQRDENDNVVSINVAATTFGDEEMQYMHQLPMLRELHVAQTQVTDTGMVHVRMLKHLEQLYLAKCAVGDTGLAHVAGLSQLRSLNIYGTQVTSEGLEHLSRLGKLRHLLITDLKLKPAAVDKLKSALPHLKVTDYSPV